MVDLGPDDPCDDEDIKPQADLSDADLNVVGMNSAGQARTGTERQNRLPHLTNFSEDDGQLD